MQIEIRQSGQIIIVMSHNLDTILIQVIRFFDSLPDKYQPVNRLSTYLLKMLLVFHINSNIVNNNRFRTLP